MSCELDVVRGRPCDLPGCAESTNPSLPCVPPRSRRHRRGKEWGVRGFGLDVHRDFCEVAVAEGGTIRSAGRIATRVDSLALFAQSLVASDVVALEATTGADKIVSLLQAHGIRVVVANTRKLKSISEAKAKTDRLDARTLARLLVSGLLDEVWRPDAVGWRACSSRSTSGSRWTAACARSTSSTRRWAPSTARSPSMRWHGRR